MYFPTLNRLNNYESINPMMINLFDDWLAMQRQAVLSNLSPIRFSIQSGIDTQIAIDMFSMAANSAIGILRAKFVVLCPRCHEPNGVFHTLEAVPHDEIICSECDECFVPYERKEFVELKFERIIEPQRVDSSGGATANHGLKSGNRGKEYSLRADEFEQNPTSARRHLLNNFDVYFEATS